LAVAIFSYVFHWLFFAKRKPSCLRRVYLLICSNTPVVFSSVIVINVWGQWKVFVALKNQLNSTIVDAENVCIGWRRL
jgi:hypothetical protein